MSGEQMHNNSPTTKATGAGSRTIEAGWQPIDPNTNEPVSRHSQKWRDRHGEFWLTLGGIEKHTSHHPGTAKRWLKDGQENCHPVWERAQMISTKQGETWVVPAVILDELAPGSGTHLPTTPQLEPVVQDLEEKLSAAEQELADAQEEHSKETTALRAEHATASKDLSAEHAAALKEMGDDHAAAVADLNDKLTAETEKRAVAESDAERGRSQTTAAQSRVTDLERKLDRQAAVVAAAEGVASLYNDGNGMRRFRGARRSAWKLMLEPLAAAFATFRPAIEKPKESAAEEANADIAAAVEQTVAEMTAGAAPAEQQKS